MTWKPGLFFLFFSSAAKPVTKLVVFGVVLSRLCCAIGQERRGLP